MKIRVKNTDKTFNVDRVEYERMIKYSPDRYEIIDDDVPIEVKSLIFKKQNKK